MNKIQSFKNSKFYKTCFSAQVFVIGFVLSATFFLFFVDVFKTYRSETSILIVAKSEIVARQQETIIENILEFPQTLSFYDTLLKYNSDVRDVAEGLSPDKRKARWNSIFSISRAGEDASVIKISITTKNQVDSQKLSQKTIRTLFDVIGAYYDVKNDIDLRIIDGPIIKSQISAWQELLALSIFLGYFIAMSLQFVFFGSNGSKNDGGNFAKMKSFFDYKKNTAMPIEQELASLNKLYQNEKVEEPFVFEKENIQTTKKVSDLIPEKDVRVQEMKKITKQFEPGRYPNFPEMPVREHHADAPDNLPVADESFFQVFNSEEEEIIEQKTSIEMEDQMVDKTSKEPTPEELKKRLNQLLRGEL